jgi:hypothetical protein
VRRLTALPILFVATIASARPQWSSQLEVGAIGEGNSDGLWKRTRFDLGLQGEVLFLRESPSDFGLGPYVQARTDWFQSGEYGGGLVALLPVGNTFPFWIGGGGFGRRTMGDWSPGVNGFVAWGARDFNYSSNYAMAFGLVLDVRRHYGDLPATDVVLAARIDLEVLALPWIFLTSAVVH